MGDADYGGAAVIEFIIPIKTVNEANGSHGHWRVKASRRKVQRNMSFGMTSMRLPLPHLRAECLPCIVTLARQSAGTLDDDNLRVSLKSIRDGIADAYGLADNDPRFEWRYGQEKAKRGVCGVRVRIESVDRSSE